jgi:putative ubiquitin-RnfH superfamily antitoxin RatB of RatAB toxin-antitoxin module
MSEKVINVEVVFANEAHQELLELTLENGSTVGQAILRSGICAMFRDEALDSFDVGIWGRPVDREQRLREGDRVEIYRPLKMDPREARRLLAEAGRTMNQGLRGSDGK